MTPATAGRHCAACQKTVIDFTLKTDAEILAYLARAAGGRTCGRFAAEQLERPLQRATPAAPAARWRAWLAAAVAVWGVRETSSISAKAQAPMEMRKMGEAAALPANLRAQRKPDYEGAGGALVLRGIVRDSATHEGLPGVTVLIKNSTVGVATGHDGTFELTLPAEYQNANGVMLRVTFIGYLAEERYTLATAEAQPLEVTLRPDNRMLGEVVMVGGVHFQQPWPWHPRRLYYWGKYWLTRPFQR